MKAPKGDYEIGIEDEKLYLYLSSKTGTQKIDISGVWHFFREVEEYIKNPKK